MRKKGKTLLAASLAVLLGGMTVLSGANVNAADTPAATNSADTTANTETSVSVSNVDYDKETLTITGYGDTEYYISDKNQKVWDTVPVTDENTFGNAVTIDISWIPGIRDYELVIKGNVSTKPLTVTIPRSNPSFKAQYDITNDTIAYSGFPSGFEGDIEWKVKGYSTWNKTTLNPAEDIDLINNIDKYLNDQSSTIVYFRTASRSGIAADNIGERASNISKVVIPRRTTAPYIGLDKTKLTMKIPANVKYRLVGDSGFSDIFDETEMNISQLAYGALYSDANTAPTDKIIEFYKEAANPTRGNVTQKSASTYIQVKAQKSADAAVEVNNLTTNVTPTPAPTTSASPTASASATPTVKPSPTPTAAPTPTPTVKPSITPTPSSATDAAPDEAKVVKTSDVGVKVVGIDYTSKDMTIDYNGSDMVFYSVDKLYWYSIGTLKDANGYGIFNLNWLDESKDSTLYLKGTRSADEKDYTQVTIPKQNPNIRVTFDKTSTSEKPILNVTGTRKASALEWRKAGDDNWYSLDYNTETTGNTKKYTIKELENMRIKSGKIVVRTSAGNSYSADDGTLHLGNRSSKEVTVTIPRRRTAPSLRINVVAMTVNTTTGMEYYDAVGKKWTACTKSMSIWNMPEVNNRTKANGSSEGTKTAVMFRYKATTTDGYSKSTTLNFLGQRGKPDISKSAASDVVVGSVDAKVGNVTNTYTTLKFNAASKAAPYQYVLVGKSDTFNVAKAKWVSVKQATTVQLRQAKAVSGAKVYVRLKGFAADKKNGKDAILPSAENYYTIP